MHCFETSKIRSPEEIQVRKLNHQLQITPVLFLNCKIKKHGMEKKKQKQN